MKPKILISILISTLTSTCFSQNQTELRSIAGDDTVTAEDKLVIGACSGFAKFNQECTLTSHMAVQIKGNVGTGTDGLAAWALRNGNNRSPYFSDRFIPGSTLLGPLGIIGRSDTHPYMARANTEVFIGPNAGDASYIDKSTGGIILASEFNDNKGHFIEGFAEGLKDAGGPHSYAEAIALLIIVGLILLIR